MVCACASKSLRTVSEYDLCELHGHRCNSGQLDETLQHCFPWPGGYFRLKTELANSRSVNHINPVSFSRITWVIIKYEYL